MLGTGLYMSDIQTTRQDVDQAMDDGIRTTIGWLTGASWPSKARLR